MRALGTSLLCFSIDSGVAFYLLTKQVLGAWGYQSPVSLLQGPSWAQTGLAQGGPCALLSALLNTTAQSAGEHLTTMHWRHGRGREVACTTTSHLTSHHTLSSSNIIKGDSQEGSSQRAFGQVSHSLSHPHLLDGKVKGLLKPFRPRADFADSILFNLFWDYQKVALPEREIRSFS